MELKLLTFSQLGIDLLIVIVFIILIKRFKHFKKASSFDRPTRAFESLLTDAEKMAGQFREQLEEKQRLIVSLNEQLDKRIISLNVLLNRADVLLSSHGEVVEESHEMSASIDDQQAEIIKLASRGQSAERIAQTLSIPQGEVKLVLDLKHKFSQMAKT